jgi:cellulose synthase/poly-beta-1,6-N-acetylglucosamine synthase-like glycosyltransferase
MAITIIIPFINRPELTRHTITNALKYSDGLTQVIALSDGAEHPHKHIPDIAKEQASPRFMFYEQENKGVLGVFQEGMKISATEIVVFAHNDLLIHEKGYDKHIEKDFEERPKLGMAGFVGARGVAGNGGRWRTTSNMLGKEWGACECHSQVGAHHGEVSTGFTYASVLDGCCTIFRRSAFDDLLAHTDCFASSRPLNHWYDRNLPLHMVKRGWQVGIIGVGFDHFSANTGSGTESYLSSVRKWGKDQGLDIAEEAPDHFSYLEGEKQFTQEWAALTPVVAYEDGSYAWRAPFSS